ncbi:MAG TPA: YtxH domain-containing protein [candidate division Zixibacteria bacterium]|nr:YtxH domain-containing protein [candidate division Zixibacteria bacterium]
MADEVSTTVRSLVERVLEADVRDQIARRGRELATAVADATDTVSDRAAEAWRESAPKRRDAEKQLRRVSRDAMKWGRRTWNKEVGPAVRRLWNRRAAALGLAGAAIPAAGELVDDAAVRLGIKRHEERRWTTFFLGLVLGAIAGAVVALMTAPKPGREMRGELIGRARDAASRARDAASGSEWVPIFQRRDTNGAPPADPVISAEAPPVANEAPIETAPTEGEEQPH